MAGEQLSQTAGGGGTLVGGGDANSKSQARNSKQYQSSKFQSPKQNERCLEIWYLRIGICFGFRACDFEFVAWPREAIRQAGRQSVRSRRCFGRFLWAHWGRVGVR